MNLLEILAASALLTLLLSQSYKNSVQISKMRKETVRQDKEFLVLREIKEKFGFYKYSDKALLKDLKKSNTSLEDINCIMISSNKLCFSCKASFRGSGKNKIKEIVFCERY